MKKISKLTVITTLITLLPIVLGIVLYDRLPDVVATHWGIDNQPNGWSSRAHGGFRHTLHNGGAEPRLRRGDGQASERGGA